MKYAVWFSVCCVLSVAVQSSPSVPSSRDQVVARWEPRERASRAAYETAWSERPEAVLEQSRTLLRRARQPGYSHLYAQVQQRLASPVETDTPRAEVWLLWARLKQHQHQFDRALEALDRLFKQDPAAVEGRLMAARIHVIRGEYQLARPHCLALVGNTDLLTASACALEVASYQGELERGYQNLQALVERESLPDGSRGRWVAQVLADMAMRQDRPAEASGWLEPVPDNASVNYLKQWADVQRALSRHDVLIKHLGPIVRSAPGVDDTLALRLALAEKATEGNEWQSYIHRRMALRAQRQDTEHASDMALYYLELTHEPEKALYWARLNWETAREHGDRQLLLKARERAYAAEQATVSESGGVK